MEVKYDTVHIVRAAEKIAAGKYDAWMLLRPLWFEIGICDGKEEYDSNAARFTAAQRKALAWIRYNNEVFDGGHRQFLINSVGIVWRDALECMEMIGAVKSANRLRKIAAAFGGEIPYEKAERKAAFDELWNRENSTFPELLEKCDKEYTFGDRADKLVEMLTDHMKSHPEDFALDNDIKTPSPIAYITKQIIRTPEEIAAGRYDLYNLLLPLRCEISIYDGKERYDSEKARFTAAQRRAFAWDYYNDEVLNGGHQQFLINSTGIVWDDVLECMEMVGADKAAENLRRIVDAFGGAIPYEKKERLAAFDDLWERKKRAFPALLKKCDSEYYSNNYSDKISEMLNDYIKTHSQEFALDGEFRFAER